MYIYQIFHSYYVTTCIHCIYTRHTLNIPYIDGDSSQRHHPLVQEKNQRLHASLIPSNSGEGEGNPCVHVHIYIFTVNYKYFSFILAKGAIFVCFVQKYFVKVWNCWFEKCCKRKFWVKFI